jgi:cytochrome d ubiquinol oxidase subunit II
MITGATYAYLVMGLGVIAYVLTGGADFGGGVWDLLASGKNKDDQRSLIAKAIAPIWEANHVWIIFVIVMMFTVFPRAYSTIGIALHIPIVVVLIGIVLRGTAFTFRAYGIQPDAVRERWGRVFGWSSLVTPVFMGMTLAAVSSGAIRVENEIVTTGAFAGWLTPFAAFTGLFTLALFALLAAVYLVVDAGDVALARSFRRRALAAEGVAGVLAALVFLTAADGAPQLFENLARSSWTWPLQGGTALFATATIVALLKERDRTARFTVAAQVTLVLLGWAAAMDGTVVMPDVTLQNAGVENAVIEALVPALSVGVALLAPALWALFRLFKSPDPEGSSVR